MFNRDRDQTLEIAEMINAAAKLFAHISPDDGYPDDHLALVAGMSQVERKPGPPRRISSCAASCPIALPSLAGPRRSVAISAEPSGLAIRARK